MTKDVSSSGPIAMVVGEALVDVVEASPDAQPRRSPGGGPANVALGLGRLGREVVLVTQLGHDADGELIRSHLEASAVTLAPVPPVERTSSAVAHLGADGSAQYEFDISWTLAKAVETTGIAAFHTGSIALLAPSGIDGMLRQVRGRALISMDPNVRLSLISDRLRAKARWEDCLRFADVVKASNEDIEAFYPGESPREIARRWLAAGPALVVVTSGSNGVWATTAHQEASMPAVAAVVQDTIGAGDTFMATLVDTLLDRSIGGRGAAARIADLSFADLENILLRCTTAASITVGRPGADLPWLHELPPRQ